MNPASELTLLLASMKLGGVKIVHKDGSRFWGFLGWCMKVLTLGKVNNFNTGFITTIGPYIAVPAGWESQSDLGKLADLTHELVHVRQFRRYTVPLFVLAYALFPVPIGLAWCRYALEREAYAAGIAKILEYNPGNQDLRRSLIEWAVKAMSGPGYFWPWPASWIRKWLEARLS